MASTVWRGAGWRQAEIAKTTERHELSAVVDDVIDDRVSMIRDRLADEQQMLTADYSV